jgi:2-phospho-L-lactate/phosphoenolpyruvate guanylyltransferase
MSGAGEASSVFAVVPVKDLAGTKSRLAPILNPGARAGLTLYMMGRVVRALREAGVGDVCVISPDPIVLNEALGRGAAPLLQKSTGLNPALEEGRARALVAGASTLLVLPADLPILDAGDVRSVLEAAGDGPCVVVSPDGARSGTNALLSRPPDALPFLFGPDSFEAHVRAARGRGLDLRICERPHLAFDLDTAGDLARLKQTGAQHP